MSDRFAVKNIFVPNFDSHNLFKFSELLDRNIHDLELPVRVPTTVDADSRAPLLLAYNDDNKWIHFIEKSGLSVMSKMSRLNMNLYEAFFWNYESSPNAYLRRCYNYFWLLIYGLLYYNLRYWDLRLDHNLRNVHLWCLNDDLWATMSMMEFRSKMDSSSWLSIEVDLNPFFSWTMLCEYR